MDLGDDRQPRRGRTLSGQTVEAFWTAVERADPLVVGVNCSLGAEEMRPYVADLSRLRRRLHRVPPERRAAQRVRRLRPGAAGDLTAARRLRHRRPGEHRRRLLRDQPERIAAIASAVSGMAPRPLPAAAPRSRFSGRKPSPSARTPAS